MQTLMMKYLTLNFPVQRIKDKKHFKRAIILNDYTCFLSDKAQIIRLYSKLYNNLELAFSERKTITENVLKEFLRLK